MNVVILKLKPEDYERLKAAVQAGSATDLEYLMWNHCYNISEADAQDSVASYI